MTSDPTNKEKNALEEAVERLTQENRMHREIVEAIQTLLRIRAGSVAEGLKPLEGIKAVLNERDELSKKVDILTDALVVMRGFAAENRLKDAVEWFRKFYKNKQQ